MSVTDSTQVFIANPKCLAVSTQALNDNPKRVVVFTRVFIANPKCLAASTQVLNDNPKCVVVFTRVFIANPKCLTASTQAFTVKTNDLCKQSSGLWLTT